MSLKLWRQIKQLELVITLQRVELSYKQNLVSLPTSFRDSKEKGGVWYILLTCKVDLLAVVRSQRATHTASHHQVKCYTKSPPMLERVSITTTSNKVSFRIGLTTRNLGVKGK